jgi:hypothetical protein
MNHTFLSAMEILERERPVYASNSLPYGTQDFPNILWPA